MLCKLRQWNSPEQRQAPPLLGFLCRLYFCKEYTRTLCSPVSRSPSRPNTVKLNVLAVLENSYRSFDSQVFWREFQSLLPVIARSTVGREQGVSGQPRLSKESRHPLASSVPHRTLRYTQICWTEVAPKRNTKPPLKQTQLV